MPSGPGWSKTEATKDGLFKNESVMAQFIAEKPLGRTGVPDDIAAGVRYLAGPESSWVTGQSLGIEGGNELTRAPYLDALVRKRFGDAAHRRRHVRPDTGLSLGRLRSGAIQTEHFDGVAAHDLVDVGVAEVAHHLLGHRACLGPG